MQRKCMSTKSNFNFKGLVFDSLIFGYLMVLFVLLLLQPTADQLLNLKQNTVWFVLSLVLGILITFVLNSNRITTLGYFIFEPPYEKLKKPPQVWFKTFWGWQLAVAFFVTFGVGLNLTDFSMHEILDEAGFLGARRIFAALLNPELSVLPQGILAIIETIYI